MFALLDCNNFFASCERVFNPKLQGKPVCVLSNNDGCIVARSNEVKALGIPMGAPYFEYREQLKKNNVHVFSSNFRLYGDMSSRVMRLVSESGVPIEVYSIDEAFLDLTGVRDQMGFCRELREKIWQCVGIPVSIGIAPSKTLAKAGSEWAKKREECRGVFFVHNDAVRAGLLEWLPINGVWGIGRNLTPRLWVKGIKTAWDLTQKNDAWLRSEMGIHGVKLGRELRGESTLSVEEVVEPQKGLACTRSFGKPVTTMKELKEAAAYHATSAAAKLRDRGLVASYLQVFIRTSRFARNQSYFSDSRGFEFPYANADTLQFVRAATLLIEQMYKEGYRYSKAGVHLSGIMTNDRVQMNLFIPKNTKQERLSKTMDDINNKYGHHAVFAGGMGIKREWMVKSGYRSPEYTTSWKDIPRVR